MPNKPFSELLVEARQAAGLKQAEAARLFGIPERTMRSWELGERTPPAYVQADLLNKLKERIKEKS